MFEIIFKNKLFFIERNTTNGYEKAVRTPGVRMLLTNNNNQLLLIREYREEQGKTDLRLPGGKIFDTIEIFIKHRGNTQQVISEAFNTAKKESKEECGVDSIINLELLEKTFCAATIEWDLYFFKGAIEKISNQELKEDEITKGISIEFFDKKDIPNLIKESTINEDRSIAIIYKYFLTV